MPIMLALPTGERFQSPRIYPWENSLFIFPVLKATEDSRV